MTHVEWNCPLETWQALLPMCPEATFFHTPEWYQARAALTPVRPTPVFFRFDDGSTALLPLAIRSRHRGLMQEALAGLEHGYGGLLAPQPLLASQREEAYRLVRRRYPDLRVTGNPFAEGPQVPEAAARTMDYTHVLPVRPPDEQHRGFAEMRGRHVLAARRAGVRIEVRHGLTPEDAACFYPLYARHVAAWKHTARVRDEAYFRELARHAGHHLALFLAFHEEKAIGMQLVAAYPPVAVQLHLATDSAHNRLNAASLLVATALEWSHANGLRHFDFLASGRLDGVKLFKASFGAEPRSYPVASQSGWLDQSLRTLGALTRRGRPRLSPAT